MITTFYILMIMESRNHCNFLYDYELHSIQFDHLTEKSALCEHSVQFDHLIDWNSSKVLKTEAHYSKRLTSEAWFIHSRLHVMNRSHEEYLPRVYHRLITS